MFYNVEYMDLPSELFDLKIEEPNEADIAIVRDRIGRVLRKENLFALEIDGRRHFVVAGSVAVTETSMGIFESPFTVPQVKLGASK